MLGGVKLSFHTTLLNRFKDYCIIAVHGLNSFEKYEEQHACNTWRNHLGPVGHLRLGDDLKEKVPAARVFLCQLQKLKVTLRRRQGNFPRQGIGISWGYSSERKKLNLRFHPRFWRLELIAPRLRSVRSVLDVSWSNKRDLLCSQVIMTWILEPTTALIAPTLEEVREHQKVTYVLSYPIPVRPNANYRQTRVSLGFFLIHRIAAVIAPLRLSALLQRKWLAWLVTKRLVHWRVSPSRIRFYKNLSAFIKK